MDKPPDYADLIRLLFQLRIFPDATGETTLTSEEAANISSLGFSAEAGRWKCPPLPPNLTRDNPLLEPLSAGWDRLQHDLRNNTQVNQPMRQGPHSQGSQSTRRPVEKRALGSFREQAPVKRPHTSSSLEVAEDYDVELVSAKIRAILDRESGRIYKRRLQQRLARYPAMVFNEALRRLNRDIVMKGTRLNPRHLFVVLATRDFAR